MKTDTWWVNTDRLRDIDSVLAYELEDLRLFLSVMDTSIKTCNVRDAIHASRMATEHLPRVRDALARAQELRASGDELLGEDIVMKISRELRDHEANLDEFDRMFAERCSCSKKKGRVVYDY